ncbi:hypothetical protein [Sphaerochaeta pleomorpha]|nr:hypothetical protein [Sphaerochaeta pleomorpha]
MSVRQAAQKWDISERRVRILCSEGRIEGVVRSGWAWNIPLTSLKPGDGRQLRHLKNFELRFGSLDLSRLDTLQKQLSCMKGNETTFLGDYKKLILRFIESSFACEGIAVTSDQLSLLFGGEFVPDLAMETQLLALNCRSILLRFVQETGLGPCKGLKKESSTFNEQRLSTLYRTMMQGIDDEDLALYRKVSIPPANPQGNDLRLFPVSVQMEILMNQYENEWIHLHPLVRALFLYGELLRICPFEHYCSVFATLVLGGELLFGGYPPVLVDPSHLDEFKASLMLTRKRGNYQNVVRMLEQSLLYELTKLLPKETLHGL